MGNDILWILGIDAGKYVWCDGIITVIILALKIYIVKSECSSKQKCNLVYVDVKDRLII